MLYKRKDSSKWWIKIRVDGRCLQQTTGTTDKRKAQEYHDKKKAELWNQIRLGKKPDRTWNEAVVRFYEESTRNEKTRKDDQSHLRFIDKFLNNQLIGNIDRQLIDKISYDRFNSGVSPSTVNRMLEIIRAVLNKAANDWEWIDKAPKVRMLEEPQSRVRFLTPQEFLKLHEELPIHLKPIMMFAAFTGLRKRNTLNLRWNQVDLNRKHAWVAAEDSKSKNAIAVPLSDEAIELLQSQIGKHPEFVFTYNGKPLKESNTRAWRNALTRAGIEDFRWHDLRHTWASWHAQSGTPLHVLQELGGWKTSQMVQRYAHLSSGYLASYAGQPSTMLEKVTEKIGYDLGTEQK